MKIPEFKTKKELFAFLVENKDTIITQKKSEIKQADAVGIQPTIEDAVFKDFQINIAKSENDNEVAKIDISGNPEDVTELKVRAVINTTNLMDSYNDVHLPGLWNKSVKENKRILFLQEHKMAFDKIIADKKDLTASVQTFNWRELGYKYPGTTEALIFDANVKQKRNSYMFDQYKQGNVDNHSVGMQYVKVEMAINDADFKEEYKTWNKYIDEIANKQDAENSGYFFAVKEAKVIEGSAVPMGANWATPTLEVNDKDEPLQDTLKVEPSEITQPERSFSEMLKEINFFN